MKKKQNFIFDENTEIYTIQLKKKNYWWLLLLLLPFLLLILQIRFSKDITFKTIDNNSGIALEGANVDFTCFDRNFIDFKSFKFATQDTINFLQSTNNQGIVVFKVSYTLFQKVFHSKDITTVIATGGCFQSDTLHPLYFDLMKQKINELKLDSRRKTLDFLVVDAFDGQVLPDADVVIDFYISGQKQSFTGKSDARGIVEAEILYCADSLVVNASKYGYNSFSNSGNIQNYDSLPSRTLPLEPILASIDFLVKDLYTKQPVPNATAKLHIDNSVLTLTTNTNGLGKGMFDSLGITKQMYIEVSHPAYYDTTTQKYTVEEFIKLNEEDRTIYIRPKPGNLTFKNVDKYTNNPISGVKNVVYVNDQLKGEYYSNSNGEFTVPDLSPNDKVSIISTHENYMLNDQSIKDRPLSQLNNQPKRTIPMEPDLQPHNVKPPRVNCRAHFSGTLLSDVFVDNHMSVIYQADKYGEYVGEGEYPNNAIAFPNAVDHTFDAIAVDKGTRVILYSEPNFQGSVLLDVTGPALINNVKWQNESRIKNVNTKTLGGGLDGLFPKSCRRWSSSNMNNWSRGSVKVICSQ
ncbi:MAG: hypothetical protein JXL97_02070 [Bacteroidales bacterium]|nr:hypothetical protein [Bacteroidales bacterium]